MSVQLLLRVAAWYHVERLGQDAIAERVGASRSSVSRLLAEARERGLLDIVPRIPGSIRHGLASYLAEAYSLRSVIVVESDGGDAWALRERLGYAAACFLQTLLRDGITVGMSWGTSTVAHALEPSSIRGASVVQMAGGLNPAPGFGPPLNEIVQVLAAKLGAVPRYLYAPAISATPSAATSLRAESSIAETLALGARANLALFGIGDLEPGTTIPNASALAPSDWARLRSAGAVGAVCVRFFTAGGSVAVRDIDLRTVGSELAELAVVPTKIGLAAGVRKRAAVLGALRAGLVDVWITDENLAVAVMAERLAADLGDVATVSGV